MGLAGFNALLEQNLPQRIKEGEACLEELKTKTDQLKQLHPVWLQLCEARDASIPNLALKLKEVEQKFTSCDAEVIMNKAKLVLSFEYMCRSKRQRSSETTLSKSMNWLRVYLKTWFGQSTSECLSVL